MRKLFLLLALIPWVAQAQVSVDNLPNGSTISSTDYTICDQSGNTNKCTLAQVLAYIQANFNITASLPALVNGDCLSNNGIALLWTTCGSGGGGTPGGASGSIQYNNAGVFGGYTYVPQSAGGTGAGSLAGASIGTFTGTLTPGHCVQWSTSTGQMSDSGAGCATGGGSTSFSSLTTGVNTTFTGTVGSGATLTFSGTGILNANELNGGTLAASLAVLASNASGQPVAASTSGTGSVCLTTSCTMVTPNLGTPGGLVLTNATGTPNSIGLTNAVAGTLPLSAIANQPATTLVGNNTASSGPDVSLTVAQVLGMLNTLVANAQTGTTYTTVLGDANNLITLSNASAVTVTVPLNSSVAYPINTVLSFEQLGTGNTSICPASGAVVTFQSARFGQTTSSSPVTGCIALNGIYGLLQMKQTSTNNWYVFNYSPAAPGVYNVASATSVTPDCGIWFLNPSVL